MKKHLSTLMLVLVMAAGLSLLLYPTFSNYWNSFHQSRVVANYTSSIAQLHSTDYDALRRDAAVYNSSLVGKANRLYMSDQEREQYQTLLNTAGNGVMATLEIPSIDVNLPIYHGTGESVLQVAIGHVEGTSLPVGGADTHCVLSGHRGLPSAALFTHLDRLSEGQRFMIHVLNETLTYEVDQILVVEPHETEALSIEPGQDLCTLITCTPYGINTHRLLVRGHRVANDAIPASANIISDAHKFDETLVFAVLCLGMMLIWMAGNLLHFKKR